MCSGHNQTKSIVVLHNGLTFTYQIQNTLKGGRSNCKRYWVAGKIFSEMFEIQYILRFHQARLCHAQALRTAYFVHVF